MNILLTAVLAVQMLSALGMIGLILVQHGKGADMAVVVRVACSVPAVAPIFSLVPPAFWQRYFLPVR